LLAAEVPMHCMRRGRRRHALTHRHYTRLARTRGVSLSSGNEKE
jgi:hypothetical protein